MKEYIASELRFFLWSASLGVLLGSVYYVLVIFRRLVRHVKLAVYIEDLLFWLVAAILMSMMLLVAMDGRLRLYSIAAFLGGLAMILFLLQFVLSKATIIVRKIRKERMEDAIYKHKRRQNKA